MTEVLSFWLVLGYVVITRSESLVSFALHSQTGFPCEPTVSPPCACSHSSLPQCYSIRVQPAENLRSQTKRSYTKPGTPKPVQCRHNAVRVLVPLRSRFRLFRFISTVLFHCRHANSLRRAYLRYSGAVAYTERSQALFLHT